MSRRRQAAGEPREVLGMRRKLLLGCFLAAMGLVLGRAFQLQALEGERWARAAEDQQRERVPLPARRGSIFDRDGVPLALSHETYQISVAPRELRDARATARLLQEALGLPAEAARRATDPRRRWVVLPGRFSAEERQRLGEARGVYVERRLERFYPQGSIAREVIGVVTGDGRALGGVEQQLDGLLQGVPGYSVLRRDARGRAQPTISLPVVPPQDGADVYLTLDLDLQEIADGALQEAIRETDASGGDLVLLDPHTGEILAAVSRRGGGVRALTAITEPFEPGSTLKPFIAAALLQEQRATMGDTVFGENGSWTDGRRTIRDTHEAEWLSLHDVLRVSSNIGIAKFAQRLQPGEQYEYLRDFGFGTPTGIEYPAESAGRLRRPAAWSAFSAASLAMGYELSATPLQVAAAYGALANGGVLMEPFLLREVREPGGAVRVSRGPRPIRRVISPEVAQQVTAALVAAVSEGTGARAGFAEFVVAGKTGTSRRTSGGRYEPGSYTSSFAGFFPADQPQVVIFVKLDEPQGAYYGGVTAAPVTRETLQGVLAARSTALETKRLLATRAAPLPRPSDAGPAARVAEAREGTFVFLLDEGIPQPADTARAEPVAVPALGGMPLRDAVRRAHALGLHTRVEGAGAVARTRPAAGAPLTAGDTLVIVGRGS